jgi:hypothetical protein
MKKQTLGLTYALIVVTMCHLLPLTTADAQALRWMRVGPLQTFFMDYGNECELLPYNHAFLSWPTQYGDNQYTTWAKGLWIGAQNFYDPVEKKRLSRLWLRFPWRWEVGYELSGSLLLFLFGKVIDSIDEHWHQPVPLDSSEGPLGVQQGCSNPASLLPAIAPASDIAHHMTRAGEC